MLSNLIKDNTETFVFMEKYMNNDKRIRIHEQKTLGQMFPTI